MHDDTQVGAEHWWPQLSIDGKHAVLRDLEGQLDEHVITEIAAITERAAPERLSAEDVRYIRTQIEPVD